MQSVLTLFFRAKGVEYSMEAVFGALEEEFCSHISFRKKYVRYYRAMPWNVIYNMFQCLGWRTRINHITGQIHYCALLLPSKRTIVTVHDVGMSGNCIKRVLLKLFWFYLPLNHVRYITCISHTIKRELLALYPFLKDKTRVVYNPVNIRFQYIPKEFDQHLPIILHIGTRPNKNLERVIPALKGIHCHLRIIGKLTQQQMKLLHDSSVMYSNAFKLTDEEIVEEYKNCDIVSFPSLYGGFGMPIIEGQAIGRVVLTSNIDPMKEIANNSALLVDPCDVASIHDGFCQLIENAELRKSLIKRGLHNVVRFQPSVIAEKYLQLYNQILENK